MAGMQHDEQVQKDFLTHKNECRTGLVIRAKRSEEEEKCPSAVSRGHICPVS